MPATEPVAISIEVETTAPSTSPAYSRTCGIASSGSLKKKRATATG